MSPTLLTAAATEKRAFSQQTLWLVKAGKDVRWNLKHWWWLHSSSVSQFLCSGIVHADTGLLRNGAIVNVIGQTLGFPASTGQNVWVLPSSWDKKKIPSSYQLTFKVKSKTCPELPSCIVDNADEGFWQGRRVYGIKRSYYWLCGLTFDRQWCLKGRALWSVCLPGRHRCLSPPDWWSCSSQADSVTQTHRRITVLAVHSAAHYTQVDQRVGRWSVICLTPAVWGVVYSGGLHGRPSSSDMVPASSILFTHMRDGGEPSLMACFSWSCRN